MKKRRTRQIRHSAAHAIPGGVLGAAATPAATAAAAATSATCSHFYNNNRTKGR